MLYRAGHRHSYYLLLQTLSALAQYDRTGARERTGAATARRADRRPRYEEHRRGDGPPARHQPPAQDHLHHGV